MNSVALAGILLFCAEPAALSSSCDCGPAHEAGSSGGTLTSPNYPQHYCDNADCQWTLTAPPGMRVEIRFSHFDTEPNFDDVTLHDGGNSSAQIIVLLTGNNHAGETFRTEHSNVMTVQFTSDGSINHKGFEATWETKPPQTPTCLCVEKKADKLRQPLLIQFEPSSTVPQVQYVIEQLGVIQRYTSDWRRFNVPFLDITDRVIGNSTGYEERGLLALAFHPDYANNNRFYVHYDGLRAADGRTLNRISQFTATAGVGNKDSEVVMIELPKPSNFPNHNGGDLIFGEDGMLYAFFGDGGGGGDTQNYAQDKSNIFATVIRIDVSQPATAMVPYMIPSDNPFVNEPGTKKEIWAWGLRNPWRSSFDRGDAHGRNRGRIFTGDVGENTWEEVNIIEKGANYGWSGKEGFSCFVQKPELCKNISGETDPIYAYDHNIGVSIIGGYVYRGCRNPSLKGLYIYGDWKSGGQLFRLKEGSEGGWENEQIFMCPAEQCAAAGLQHKFETDLLSLSEDYTGELYILVTGKQGLSSDAGAIYRLADPNHLGSPTCTDYSRPIIQ